MRWGADLLSQARTVRSTVEEILRLKAEEQQGKKV